jgi:hypothetical protein
MAPYSLNVTLVALSQGVVNVDFSEGIENGCTLCDASDVIKLTISPAAIFKQFGSKTIIVPLPLALSNVTSYSLTCKKYNCQMFVYVYSCLHSLKYSFT